MDRGSGCVLCSLELEEGREVTGWGRYSSILGALAWGWGPVIFQDLPPKAKVDSDGQASNGGDAI